MPEVNGEPLRIDLSRYASGRLPIVVVRSDYTDDRTWADLLAELAESPGGDVVAVHPVSGPAWSGVGADAVLAALTPGAPVAVFIADATTMNRAGRPMVVVRAVPAAGPMRDDGAGRQFRAAAEVVPVLHLNLERGSLPFEEYHAAARGSAWGVYSRAS